jgi:hypothetical protein
MSTTMPTETLELPIGDMRRAEIRVAFGGGELMLRQAAPGLLVAGSFDGGVVHEVTATGALKLEPAHPAPWFRLGRPIRWDVGITAEIPVDLRLETGANRSTVDLAALRIERLELHTGASDTDVRLPAVGRTSVRVACGFAAVRIEVPAGVAARIRSQMALGSTTVDPRFPRVEGGWASPDFETAENRVDLQVEGGFGSVEVH